MGNEESHKANTNVEIELNHSRIRFIKVINDPKQRHMQASFTNEKKDYTQWATLLATKKPNSTHLLLPISHEFQTAEFCGNSGQAKVNYENYPYLLQEEIENRRHKKRRFDETELWLLLYCLLEAQKEMKTFTESEIGVGDVRPENIFLNEEGKMKVACGWSWPKETNNYQKFLENEVTYLAPEDLPFIEQQKVSNEENTKSETFSIGLTILSAANLTSYNNLYNLSAKRFNIEEFTHVLNEWRLNEFYSDIFKATLGSMLEVDVANRIDDKTMASWIEKYRENILARKDFVINDPPQAIINEVQIINKLYETVTSSKFGGMSKFEGSRRIVVGETRQFVPSMIVPPVVQQSFVNPVTESAYTSIDKNATHMSSYLLQGAPIVSTQPVFINRSSVPTLYSENKPLVESVYTRNYGSVQQNQQSENGPGLLSMGKMNFEYNTFGSQQNQQHTENKEATGGEEATQKSQRGTEKKITNQQEPASNQPEIAEDPKSQQEVEVKE